MTTPTNTETWLHRNSGLPRIRARGSIPLTGLQTSNLVLQQTAGQGWFLGFKAHRCPSAGELRHTLDLD